jgi:hypothetical protein
MAVRCRRIRRRRGKGIRPRRGPATLVVDSIGFRDDLWIDWAGSVITESAKVHERIRRPDFGHLEIEVTVDDPKAYTKPWTVTLHQQFAADAELIDEICIENEKSSQHLK